MRKIFPLILFFVIITACQVIQTQPQAAAEPAAEMEQTISASVRTSVSATLTALPEPTSLSPSSDPSPTVQPTEALPTPTATISSGIPILVYFTEQTRLEQVAVTRYAPVNTRLPDAVLQEFFRGPTEAEQQAGLTAVLSGFTGYSQLDIQDNIARLYLIGSCASNGAAYTIAQPLMSNLLQFEDIQYVKIYDESGTTEQPDGSGNSIPACLEP